MSLLENTPYNGDYDNEEFLTVIETLLPAIKENCIVREVTSAEAHRFEHRFYSLLNYLQIPSRYYYTVLRCNDLMSPLDYTQDRLQIIMPLTDVIDHLYGQYITSQKNQ